MFVFMFFTSPYIRQGICALSLNQCLIPSCFWSEVKSLLAAEEFTFTKESGGSPEERKRRERGWVSDLSKMRPVSQEEVLPIA